MSRVKVASDQVLETETHLYAQYMYKDATVVVHKDAFNVSPTEKLTFNVTPTEKLYHFKTKTTLPKLGTL
jgi:hypothetical protein